jgi:hypothetical protein
LIKGKVSTRKEVDRSKKTGIIEKVWQIVLLLLDRNDIVLFDKGDFLIKKYSEIQNKKICRVVHPYITKIQQSFANYIGRFGIPAYPGELLDEIFSKKARSEDHESK